MKDAFVCIDFIKVPFFSARFMHLLQNVAMQNMNPIKTTQANTQVQTHTHTHTVKFYIYSLLLQWTRMKDTHGEYFFQNYI